MTERSETLLADALTLPEQERAELADRLFESLDPPSDIDSMSEEELLAELDRRAAEMRSDPSSRIPWEQVQKMW